MAGRVKNWGTMKGEKWKPGFTEQAFKSAAAPLGTWKNCPKFLPPSQTHSKCTVVVGQKNPVNNSVARIPPKMLRPNIWVEKIENSPCRVQGWLRLSAARSGSDWSKSFPSDFSKMGELRRRRRGEGGRGAPLLQNRGQFGPRQNMLRVSDPFCQNFTSTTVPQPSSKEYSLCRF